MASPDTTPGRGADGQALAEACAGLAVVAAIPAVNQARSVAHVVERVAVGLAKQQDSGRAGIVVVDAGSRDRTAEAARASRTDGVGLRVVELPAGGARGRAILAALAAAPDAGRRACTVIDAGLESIDADGLEGLLRPILVGEAEYVSPTYSHGVAEATLTTNLLAPLARALFGRRIRQLVGHCFAVSPALAARFVERAATDPDLAERAPDVWLPLEALASDAAVVEAYQGRKVLDAGLVLADLATTLAQVVGPCFSLMERYPDEWLEVRGSRPLPRRGEEPRLLPAAPGVHVERMIRAFRLGLKDLLPVWEEILAEETLVELYPLGLLAADEFRFDAAVWARVVYDFAAGHREHRLPREHLLRALTPLYLGRAAAFLLQAAATPPEGLADLVEEVGLAFEAEKGRLGARWR